MDLAAHLGHIAVTVKHRIGHGPVFILIKCGNGIDHDVLIQISIFRILRMDTGQQILSRRFDAHFQIIFLKRDDRRASRIVLRAQKAESAIYRQNADDADHPDCIFLQVHHPFRLFGSISHRYALL